MIVDSLTMEEVIDNGQCCRWPPPYTGQSCHGDSVSIEDGHYGVVGTIVWGWHGSAAPSEPGTSGTC